MLATWDKLTMLQSLFTDCREAEEIRRVHKRHNHHETTMGL